MILNYRDPDPIPIDTTKTIVNVSLHKKLNPLFFKYRYKILYGGRGSGKSWSIAIYIIIKCLQSKQRVLCLREFQASIEQSVYNLFTSIIELFNLQAYFNILNNKITCFNGSLIFFKGAARNPSSLKSLEGITICWFEEAQVASNNSLELLLPTIRKSKSEVIFTLNPENDEDPIMKAFFKKVRNNTLYVELNFDDNPFFTEEMEELRLHCLENDPELYEHIWAGKTRKYSQEQIFGGKWVIATLDPPKGTIMYQGLDWGYSSDPFAFVQIYINHDTNELFIYREAGGYHVEIDDYPAHLKPIAGSNRFATYCDSANPGNMNLLKRMGYNTLPCKKYSGSVEDGITYIRSFKRIYVDPSCIQTIAELKNYKWKRDPKTMQLTPVPIDKFNHYCVEENTEITTLRGQIKIKDLLIGDNVLTRKGYRPVTDIAFTGIKQCYEIRTPNVKVTLTGLHKLYVNNQFIRVQEINIGDNLCVIYRNGMELIGTKILKAIIGQQLIKRINTCTEKYTDIIVERFQKVIMFTTLMKTNQTIILPIYNAYQKLTIAVYIKKGYDHLTKHLKVINKQDSIEEESVLMHNENIWQVSIIFQKVGIQVLKVSRSTERLVHLLTKTLNPLKSCVFNALNTLCLKSSVTRTDFVPTSANHNGEEMKVLTILKECVLYVKKNMRQTNIERPKLVQEPVQHITNVGKRRVYDITVAGEHEYFANYILSHNCDSIRYALTPFINNDNLSAQQWGAFTGRLEKPNQKTLESKEINHAKSAGLKALGTR